MKIGKIDFNENLGKLSFTNFSKFWKGGKYEEKTGASNVEAAKLLGIKTPKKDKPKEGKE